MDDVLNHLLRLLGHQLVFSSCPVLSSGCSFSSFSRVAERAGFPAVLFTIHFGGFEKLLLLLGITQGSPAPPVRFAD